MTQLAGVPLGLSSVQTMQDLKLVHAFAFPYITYTAIKEIAKTRESGMSVCAIMMI